MSLISLHLNNYNTYINYPMKLVFFGDSMFGRNNNPFVTNPFTHIEHILKEADALFFNLCFKKI